MSDIKRNRKKEAEVSQNLSKRAQSPDQPPKPMQESTVVNLDDNENLGSVVNIPPKPQEETNTVIKKPKKIKQK